MQNVIVNIFLGIIASLFAGLMLIVYQEKVRINNLQDLIINYENQLKDSLESLFENTQKHCDVYFQIITLQNTSIICCNLLTNIRILPIYPIKFMYINWHKKEIKKIEEFRDRVYRSHMELHEILGYCSRKQFDLEHLEHLDVDTIAGLINDIRTTLNNNGNVLKPEKMPSRRSAWLKIKKLVKQEK